MTFKTGGIVRRQFIFGAVALHAISGAPWGSLPALAGDDAHPFVVLNAALLETALALGFTRFGATGARSYRDGAFEFSLPQTVFDVGTQSEPNLELLFQVQPSMFLHSPEWPPDPEALRRVAPVINVPIYEEEGDAYHNAGRALFQIADLLGARDRAQVYRSHVDEVFAAAREQVAPYQHLKFLVVESPGPRSMGSAGRGGLFGGVLRELGLENAITERGNYWGFAAVTMKQMLAMDDVWAVHIGPLPRRLTDNPFWQLLPFVQKRRLVVLPDVWMWGALPSAARMARLLTEAMKELDHGAVR